MDIQSIVKELKRERDRLSKAIAALEETDLASAPSMSFAASNSPAVPAKKRGRSLTPEGRKRLSENMKKRWAERKKSSRAGKKA